MNHRAAIFVYKQEHRAKDEHPGGDDQQRAARASLTSGNEKRHWAERGDHQRPGIGLELE
jgi:hypothetical protein